MEHRIYYEDYPEVERWGDKYIVPLNIEKEVICKEDGTEVTGYRADIVERVEALTVKDITAAAVAETIPKEKLERIYASLDDAEDEEVREYISFISEIKAAARALGYPERA